MEAPRRPGRVWSVANQKGGVGKTTTAVSLGGLVALQGGRALLVDLDPHGSLTSYFGHDPETVAGSVYDLFRDPGTDPRMLLRDTGVDGLQLLPAGTAQATLDRQLGGREGMGLVIRRALEALADDCDVVFLDCPPMLGVLMVNALAACDELLIPVQTEFLALKGLERMLHTLAMVQRSRGMAVPYRVIPTMYDQRTRACREALAEIRRSHGAQAWADAIPEDTQFRDASRSGRPLTVLRPWERGSQAYRRLLESLWAGQVDPKVARHG